MPNKRTRFLKASIDECEKSELELEEIERLCGVWQWATRYRDRLYRIIDNYKTNRFQDAFMKDYEKAASRFDRDLIRYTKRSEPPYSLFKDYTGVDATLSWIRFYLEIMGDVGVTLLKPGYKARKYRSLALAVYALEKIVVAGRQIPIDLKGVMSIYESNASLEPLSYYFEIVLSAMIKFSKIAPTKERLSLSTAFSPQISKECENVERIIKVLSSEDVREALVLKKELKFGGPRFASIVALSQLTGVKERTIEKALEECPKFTLD